MPKFPHDPHDPFDPFDPPEPPEPPEPPFPEPPMPPGPHGPFGGQRRKGFPGMGRGRVRAVPVGKPWGPPPPFGGQHHRAGRKPRRDEVRAAALLLLEEREMSGYEVIQELQARTHGLWRLSPGMLYPLLQHLEEEGLVEASRRRGARAFRLTDAGEEEVAAHREEWGEPWDAAVEAVDDGVMQLQSALQQVTAAAWQVAEAGTGPQLERANALLSKVRRELYLMLAEEDASPEDAVPDDA
ncbi:hypothetical protein BIV57_05675 [Mangrovactinospora gilvigrisea]|uniref:Transcription regulator PadR N-terminal domain-containing protein n=1 Tax=Mangrovactinospora gilvigrisea TaxID=1428644 RepID=A0A1J7CFP9_9ACTN|nr:PadR family transcriptional regulator [Mangrovactinospora gilvigrisea]OIV38490.1 hypothetical protein BIV57_05675 [Mangrovactinospora gilvigrisea]